MRKNQNLETEIESSLEKNCRIVLIAFAVVNYDELCVQEQILRKGLFIFRKGISFAGIRNPDDIFLVCPNLHVNFMLDQLIGFIRDEGQLESNYTVPIRVRFFIHRMNMGKRVEIIV